MMSLAIIATLTGLLTPLILNQHHSRGHILGALLTNGETTESLPLHLPQAVPTTLLLGFFSRTFSC